MKQYIQYIVWMVALSTGVPAVIASPGCISDRDGTRQTSYRSVRCACPCKQFPRYPKRHICAGCGHLGYDRYDFFERSGTSQSAEKPT